MDSELVSIPQWCDCCLGGTIQFVCGLSFNPTMVRLLPVAGSTDFPVKFLFQSHNGAIAAKMNLKYRQSVWMFQSHNGAIAAKTQQRFYDTIGSFNPTMVRLLLMSGL